jgi:ABC-type glycerol-3-phosphate transport system permease component
MNERKLSPAMIAVFIVLFGYLVITVYPVIWVGYTSLKSDQEIFLSPFALPSQMHWDNYRHAWVDANFSRYFFNSVLVSFVSVAGTLFVGSMAAYALSRFRFPGNKLMYFVFLSGLMIPIQLSIIPLFFQMRDMHLLNSRLGLMIFYIATGLPFAVFVLAGFFKSLPASLHEAAQIDGCSEWRIYWSIMLPLSRPGLITVAVFSFLGVWNEYFGAFMFMSGAGGEEYRTLPLGLANITITSQYRSDWGTAFAGLVLVMVPTLLVFIPLQRYLVKGITAGALKG